MKARYVSFDFGTKRGPNVTNNFLPNHSGPKIHTLIEDPVKRLKTRVNDIKTFMGVIHKALVQAKFLQPKKGKIMKEERQNKGLFSH